VPGPAAPLPAGAERLAAELPLELIEEVIGVCGVRERRRRLLPAAAVMVFVLGLCLFSGEGYGEVARKLAGWLGPLAGREHWPVPGTSALARARRRLGARPFELLFAALASPLAGAEVPGAAAFGRALLLMSVDGTTVDVPAGDANIAAFGPPPSGRSRGAFPQVRLLALIGCGTRGLAGAALGPRTAGEQALARQIAARGTLGAGMLVLADRNFCGHPVVTALTRDGADVLIRARSSQQLPVLQALPDGSYLSVLPDPAGGNETAAEIEPGDRPPAEEHEQQTAGLVDDDRQVRVSRRPVTEGALQRDLTRGRRQEIGAAHDLGHALRLVVDDDSELVREDSIGALDHEITR